MSRSGEMRGATPITPKKERKPIRIRIPRSVVVVILVIASVILLGMALRHEIRQWNIAHVEIGGQYSLIEPRTIAQVLLPFHGAGFFQVDVRQIRLLVQQVPLVDQVSVTKRWPDTLEILVTEKVPVARWESDRILTSDGSISIRPDNFSGTGLPQFSGHSDWRDALVRHYRQVQKTLAQYDLVVTHLSMNSVRSLEATLSNGWQIRFGRQFFEDRLLRLEKLLGQLANKNVQYIDLRYGKGAAIRWTETGENS